MRYALFLALAACATGAESRAMVPPATQSLNSPLRGAIALTKVAGGEDTNPMTTSKVGDTELGEALRMSLEKSGLLAQGKPSFALEATLVELKQPTAGFTMKVDSLIRYKLVATADGRVVFDDIVTGSYAATMDDAVYGGTRLKLANEGAVRANIAAFLSRLEDVK